MGYLEQLRETAAFWGIPLTDEEAAAMVEDIKYIMNLPRYKDRFPALTIPHDFPEDWQPPAEYLDPS